MIVVVGEILIDRFQEYQRIGGAPFNFAFHLKKLGLQVRFYTRVGDDRNGRRIIDMLEKNGFNDQDVQVDRRHPTGMVHVDLDEHGVPHFDIRENAAYDHLDLDRCVAPDADATDMIYFGTLLQRTDSGCRQVQRFLARQSGRATRFCDINMRPPFVNPHALAGSLHHADLLKLNEAELMEIQRAYEAPTDTDDLISWLMETYAVSSIAVTRGSRGSTIYHRDARIDHPGVPGTAIVDTVGAGDGYAAILAAGYVRQLPWEETIGQASRFAARICGIPGAVPDDEKFYEDFRLPEKGSANGR